MTEEELYGFLIEKGFTETTIGPFAKRTFIATDINNNEINITFNKGQDSYEYVTINTSDGILSSVPIPTDQLKNMNFQQLAKLMNTGNSSHSTLNISPSDPSSFTITPNSQQAMEGLSTYANKKGQVESNGTESQSSNLINTSDGIPSDSSDFKGISNNKVFSNMMTNVSSFFYDTEKKILTNKEEATFNVDEYKSLKGFDIKIDLEDVKTLRDKVCDASSYFNDDVMPSINKVISSLEELNPITKEKLQSTIDLEYLTLSLSKQYRSNITGGFNDLISKLTQNIKDNGAIDDGSGSATPIGSQTQYTGGHGGGGGHSGGSTDTTTVDDITPETPINQDNLDKLTPAIAGMVTFTEVVSMYTSIGSENPVQSSLTSNYGLLGLVHQSDKYYYKIIDKSTGQVYFVEMNDKAKITWDERGERESVEIVGAGVNILKLPQEGDVLVRNPEVGDVYFLNGEKMTFDGIDYYFIFDNVTGEVAYIPLSSGVSEPTLVSNLGGIPLANSSSEVVQ